MFDNQSHAIKSNQPNSVPPKIGLSKLSGQNSLDQQQSAPASPPPNLPIAQDRQKNNSVKAPDDIFGEVDQTGDDNIERLVSNKPTANNFLSPTPAVNKNIASPVEIDKRATEVLPQANQNYLNKSDSQPSAPALATNNQQSEITVPQPPLPAAKQKSFLRKFFIFVLSAVILSLLIVGGILIYKIFKSSKILPANIAGNNSIIDDLAINEENNLNSPPLDEPPIEPPPSIIPTPAPASEEPPPAIEPEFPPKPEPILDTDLDKIPDAEEIEIGTNPRAQDTDLDKLTDYEEVYTYKTDPTKADTDSDQLTDAEEINIYKTDPLKNDTDGDGYSDGQEVKNGYNPKGEGRLENF